MAEARDERVLAKGAQRWLRFSLVAALVAPLLLLPLATGALADGLGRRGAIQLAGLTAHVEAWRTPSPSPFAVYLDAPAPVPVRDEPPEADASALRHASAARAPSARQQSAGKTRGLRIRVDTVLRAARSGARPTGTPTPARDPRPVGLTLQGVSQFGAGLVDGDVLTHISGAPALSAGTVIGAVVGALRAGAPMLGAVVWRGDQPIQVTVELPRLRPPSGE
ncbi:hypothetical protein [Chondromyces apiculatus]|uniref:PDZ domain-containing protein n=1 Tax=Chondromyces apiculatus DSM 436 TaxID=1192034 RepID=A0A017TEI7_9BACT|nr:hypothetical protein [Chondromyces apiculatus]EYF07337.1 Hypothetical protein CAP_0090 [Chondromyces apiculatus DSM 436]